MSTRERGCPEYYDRPQSIRGRGSFVVHKLSYSVTGVRKHACTSFLARRLAYANSIRTGRRTHDAAHQRNLCSYARKMSDFALDHIRPSKPALRVARFATAIPCSNPGPQQDSSVRLVLCRAAPLIEMGGEASTDACKFAIFYSAKRIVVLSMYTSMPPVSECGTPHPLACQPCLTGRGTCHPEPWEIANSTARS